MKAAFILYVEAPPEKVEYFERTMRGEWQRRKDHPQWTGPWRYVTDIQTYHGAASGEKVGEALQAELFEAG